MRPKVSIFALVYRSIAYARHIHEAVVRYTPEISAGEAEFYLVANAPTKSLKRFLEISEIPHLVFRPPKPNVQCGPDYLHGVYAAYNFGIEAANAESVVLLNSDMVPSYGWLPGLLDESEPHVMISPRLVEPIHPKHGVFPGAIPLNLGFNPIGFDWQSWDTFTKNQHDLDLEIKQQPPYMPVVVNRAKFLKLGGFPHGNVRRGQLCVPGDQFYFERLALEEGVSHRFSKNPIFFYHFKEGEKRTELLFQLVTFWMPALARFLRLDKLIHRMRGKRIRPRL